MWLAFRDNENKLVLKKRTKLESHTEKKYNSLLEKDTEKYNQRFGAGNWRYATQEEINLQDKISNQVSIYTEPEDIN